MTKWQRVCREVFEERGGRCEICGTDKNLDAPHHAIIRRSKPYKKWLDVKFNLILVCREHHEHSDADRARAWKVNRERYGRDAMISWLDSVPMIEKSKPRVEWMER